MPTPLSQRDFLGKDRILITSRRAKIKLMAKKSLETGEDIDQIPESMKQYLAMQAMESGKGLGGFFGRSMMQYGQQGLFGGDQGGQGKVCKYRSVSLPTCAVIDSLQ